MIHGNDRGCLISMLGREKKLTEANYKIYYNDSDDSSHVLGVLYMIGRSGPTEAES